MVCAFVGVRFHIYEIYLLPVVYFSLMFYNRDVHKKTFVRRHDMPLIDSENHIDISFYNSQAFETVACMHAISDSAHHVNSRVLIESIVEKTPKIIYNQILEYSLMTYNWTLILDMIAGISQNSAQSFQSSIDLMSNLSLVDFSYFIFGGNKVSQECLHDWIKNPDLVFEVDESYFPTYTCAKKVHDYLINAEFHRNKIIETICDFWHNSFSHYWEMLEPHINNSIDEQRQVLVSSGINSFLKNLNPNITFQDGKFIYSNLEVYPVYNFPFFKDFSELRVFPSLFTSPHNYISHHHDFLILGKNLILPQPETNYVEEKLTKGFKALSDDTRLKIVSIINKSPMTTKMLSEELKLSMGNISKHLQLLKECDFVITHKNKQEVFYSLKKDSIFNIFSLTRNFLR